MAAALRVYGLGDKSLWYDEAKMFEIASGGLSQVVDANLRVNSAPPLFALLLSAAVRFGSSEACLRAVACAAGVAAVPAVYALARRYTTLPWALAAAAFYALSPRQIALAQQAREYSLTFLLACLMLFAAQAFLDRPRGRSAVALGSAIVVALASQYGLALLAASTGLASALTLARRRAPAQTWALWVGAQAAGLAAAAAVAATSLVTHLSLGRGGVLAPAAYLEAGYWDGTFGSLRRLMVDQTAALSALAFPSLLFTFLCLLGVAAAASERRGRAALLMFGLPVALTFAAALAHGYPYNGSRQVVFLTPMFYVMAAIGLARLREAGTWWRGGAGIAVLLLAGSSVQQTAAYYANPGQEPLAPVLTVLRQQFKQGDRIFVSWRSAPAFAYYTRDKALQWEVGTHFRGNRAGAIARFENLMADPAPWWLVFSDRAEEGRAVYLDHLPPGRRLRAVAEVGAAVLYRVESP